MGRRLTMMITSAVGIVGVALTLIQNFYVFNVGRILYGFAAGAQGATVVRMIVEFMPEKRQSTCIGVFAMSQNLAALLAMFSAFILPKNDDIAGLEDNGTWRLILALPGVLFTFIIIGFAFFFRTDSPKYYVQKGDHENAI